MPLSGCPIMEKQSQRPPQGKENFFLYFGVVLQVIIAEKLDRVGFATWP